MDDGATEIEKDYWAEENDNVESSYCFEIIIGGFLPSYILPGTYIHDKSLRFSIITTFGIYKMRNTWSKLVRSCNFLKNGKIKPWKLWVTLITFSQQMS